MSRIYLDASCIIYLIEAASPFHAAVAAKLVRYRTDPSAAVVTSRSGRRIAPIFEANAAPAFRNRELTGFMRQSPSTGRVGEQASRGGVG